MQGNSPRSGFGFTQFTNPGNGGFAPIGPGVEDSVFWSNGVTNSWNTDPNVNSIGLGPVGSVRALTGLVRVPHNSLVINGRNQANTLDIPVLSWGIINDQIHMGDGNTDEVFFFCQNNQLRLRNNGFWTNTTGAAITIQPSSTSILTDGSPAQIRGQTLTGAGAADSEAGEGIVLGGENQRTSGNTHRGGKVILIGGNAPGPGGGTYLGGDIWLSVGIGTTRNGNVWIGNGNPNAHNFQGMGGGVAIEVAASAPAVVPANHAVFYCSAHAVLATPGNWAIGEGPYPTTGLIRVGHNKLVIAGRNGANTANRNILSWGVIGTDDWQLGDNSAGVNGSLVVGAGNTLSIQYGGNSIVLPGTVAAAATAGAGVLPATPQEFLNITVLGNARKIPLYLV